MGPTFTKNLYGTIIIQSSKDNITMDVRTFNKDEIKAILDKHEVWLQTDGTEGERADFRDAFLGKEDLRGVNLSKAFLVGTSFREALLSQINLQEADLRGADLSHADLSQASLKGANLSRAVLIETNLREADFREADLYKAKLNNANLSHANLGNVPLGRTATRGANLEGVQWDGGNITELE